MATIPELTTEEIELYDSIIDNDKDVEDKYKTDPTVREVMRAGLWLAQRLGEAQCPNELILRIQYTAGEMSFGHDPWQVVSELLEDYTLGKLNFEPSPNQN